MSNGLALSAVTAVLQYYLNELYLTSPPFTSTVAVSCLAPDLVQQSFEQNAAEPENQVNLFLHQVVHNAAWRNVGLPSLAADGTTRLNSPPLALDLHYLLTVYATDFWQAEALLGYALMMLHENPVLLRGDIATALGSLATPFPDHPLTKFLPGSGLADQIEMIKITPETLSREELAWLWTALKADYRPTYPFQVSVVLIQPQQPTTIAPPVLRRHLKVRPIQPAQILEVTPPNKQLAAAPTDTVTVTGEFLSAVTAVSLSNPRYGIEYSVPVTGVTGASFSFVPDASSSHPAGIYSIAAVVTDAAGDIVQTTNSLPLAVAPVLPSQTATPTASAAGPVVNVSFSPNAIEGQTVSLALSTIGSALFNTSVPAQPFTGSVGSLDFVFPPGLPSAALLGRLQIDGVTSLVEVDWTVHPPVFTGPLVTT